jgi:hypothetical protein
MRVLSVRFLGQVLGNLTLLTGYLHFGIKAANWPDYALPRTRGAIISPTTPY